MSILLLHMCVRVMIKGHGARASDGDAAPQTGAALSGSRGSQSEPGDSIGQLGIFGRGRGLEDHQGRRPDRQGYKETPPPPPPNI